MAQPPLLSRRGNLLAGTSSSGLLGQAPVPGETKCAVENHARTNTSRVAQQVAPQKTRTQSQATQRLFGEACRSRLRDKAG